jgi:hypothetical protein
VGYAKTAVLNDSDVAVAYRANYSSDPNFAAGASTPSKITAPKYLMKYWAYQLKALLNVMVSQAMSGLQVISCQNFRMI